MKEKFQNYFITTLPIQIALLVLLCPWHEWVALAPQLIRHHVDGYTLLGGYLILEGALFFWFQPMYENYLSRRQERPLVLRRKNESGLANGISLFIEYAILNRYSFFGYKNSVRVNLRMIGCAFVTALAASLLLVATPNLPPTGFAALGTLFASLFIVERTSVYNKWQYLAGLYNKVIEADVGYKREVLRVALVLDIIEMEMWSHRSFDDIFEDVLTEATARYLEKYPFKISKAKYALDEPLFGKMTKQLAIEVVQKYQNELIIAQKLGLKYRDVA